MAVTASSVIQRVSDTLMDTSFVRWTVAELVRALNDGQRETVTYRPDASSTEAAITLIAGYKQSIPATSAKLITIMRNTDGKAVTLVLKDVLDRFKPGWPAMRESTLIQHYMHDPRDPRVFYVYPPAEAGASLDTIQSVYPTDIAAPGGNTIGDVSGNIALQDQYANALYDYVLYRAFSKDAQHAAYMQRSATHYTLFANALGVELKGGIGASPTNSSAFNKQYPARAAV